MNIVTEVVTLLSIAAAILITAVALKQVKHSAAASLTALAISIAIWSLASRAEQSTTAPGDMALARSLTYFGMSLAAGAQLVFALAYANRPPRNKLTTGLILLAFPLFTQLLLLLRPLNGFLAEKQLSGAGLVPLDQERWISLMIGIYVFSLVSVGLVLVIDTLSRKPRPLWLSSWTIPTGSILLFLAPVLDMGNLVHVNGLDPQLPA